jgi:hypothetical protein
MVICALIQELYEAESAHTREIVGIGIRFVLYAIADTNCSVMIFPPVPDHQLKGTHGAEMTRFLATPSISLFNLKTLPIPPQTVL